jgi:hypothetical protein
MAAAGLQRSFNHPGIWCRQHGARQGQPLKSKRCEHGCKKRWWGGVTVSYGRDTNDDEVQWSKELTVMGRRTRKLNVQQFTFAMATKRSLAKVSIDPRCTSLLASEDSKVMDIDRDENAMDDFSTLTFPEP